MSDGTQPTGSQVPQPTEEPVKIQLRDVLSNFADRINSLEVNLYTTQQAMGKVSEGMKSYQEDMTALQIASMMLLLRAIGVKDEDIHKQLDGYLEMSKVYAKKFMGGKNE